MIRTCSSWFAFGNQRRRFISNAQRVVPYGKRSFFDRAMRDHDEMVAFARYVIENPARAGLPEERRRYPFVGSDTTTIEQILTAICRGECLAIRRLNS